MHRNRGGYSCHCLNKNWNFQKRTSELSSNLLHNAGGVWSWHNVDFTSGFTATATFNCLTSVLTVVLHTQFILLIIFCMIISAAPIKKCQKLGTYITTCRVVLWWMQWKFQNLPKSQDNAPRPSSGRDNQYKLQVLFANPYIFQFLICTFHHVNLC